MAITRQSVETPVGPVGLAILYGLASVLIVGFGVALCLSPDVRGYGTHEQLGLPACAMRSVIGFPCPGCGMTTCFAHFVRGEFVEAARANLAGVVLAAVSALLIPWCLWSARIGRLWMVSNPVVFAAIGTSCLSGLAMMLWVVRLFGAMK